MSMMFLPSILACDVKGACCRIWGALFGQDIQNLREEKRLSLEETAGRAGMTVAEWEAIEAGQVPQTWEQVCAMAKGLRESRLEMASLVLLYAGAWDDGPDLPGEISQR